MSRIVKWDPPRVMKALRAWVDNPEQRPFMVEGPERTLKDYVTGHEARLGVVGVELWKLSEWYLALGAAGRPIDERLADTHLACAAVLGTWSHLIKGALFESNPRRFPRLLFNDVGLSLALALTAGRYDQAGELGRRLGSWVRGGAFHLLTNTAVAPFVIALYQDWSRVDAGADVLEQFQNETYRRLLLAWRLEEDDVRPVIESACDFHISRSRDDLATQTFEFSALEYRLLPVEILAVQRLRRELGLQDVRSEHQLLAPPLGVLPSVREPELSELIQATLAKVRGEIAGLRVVS